MVPGVVVAPPWLVSFVSRHISENWAQSDKHGEGAALVAQLLDYGRRAKLLLLPLLSENHWTLLVVQRERAKMVQVAEPEPVVSEGTVGCSSCRGAGCHKCDHGKLVTYIGRHVAEAAFLDPLKSAEVQPAPCNWWDIRYYDSLDSASPNSAKLAVAVLDALQPIGVLNSMGHKELMRNRVNMRTQGPNERCGWWCLHYIEEEHRRFRGEGTFSFEPNLDKRVRLLTRFLEKIR